MAGPLSLVTVPIFSISLSTAAALFRSAVVIMEVPPVVPVVPPVVVPPVEPPPVVVPLGGVLP